MQFTKYSIRYKTRTTSHETKELNYERIKQKTDGHKDLKSIKNQREMLKTNKISRY